MEGLDDIGLTLRHVDQIDEFERRRPAFKPATLPAKVGSARRLTAVSPGDRGDTQYVRRVIV